MNAFCNLIEKKIGMETNGNCRISTRFLWWTLSDWQSAQHLFITFCDRENFNPAAHCRNHNQSSKKRNISNGMEIVVAANAQPTHSRYESSAVI